LCLAKLRLTFTTQGAQAMNMSHTEALNHNQPQIVLAPSKSALRDGGSHAFELLVRIQAPDVPAIAGMEGPPRPAQALALVIDSSGSMEGRPLEQAKRCAQWVVSRMRAHDRVAVVQFNQDVKLLWPAAEVGNGQALSQTIGRIESGGCTALHGGWLEGAKALAQAVKQGLRRVILLSDGEANVGEVEPDLIAAQCREWAGLGITTSTYGLGNGFNEDLMVAMARAGGGGHYYGHTADDLMAPFEKELEMLASLCLSEVRLSIKPAKGVQIEMLNDHPNVDGVYALPDLAHEAEGWALLRVMVSAEAMGLARTGAALLKVIVSGRGGEGQSVLLDAAELRLPVLPATDWAALPADELVTRRWTEVSAAQALKNVRQAAQRGDWGAAEELLSAAQREYAASQWVSHILEAMQRLLAERDAQHLGKELLYSAATLTTRLRSKRESVQMDVASEATMPKFLRRDVEQGRSRL
jgi:Ca-activated chloride channel family protein